MLDTTDIDNRNKALHYIIADENEIQSIENDKFGVCILAYSDVRLAKQMKKDLNTTKKIEELMYIDLEIMAIKMNLNIAIDWLKGYDWYELVNIKNKILKYPYTLDLTLYIRSFTLGE